MTATTIDSQALLEARDMAKDFHALLDTDLYLPKACLADRKRRLRRLGRSGIRLSELRKCSTVSSRCSVKTNPDWRRNWGPYSSHGPPLICDRIIWRIGVGWGRAEEAAVSL